MKANKLILAAAFCAVLSAVGVTITTIGAEGMRSSVLGLLILLGALGGSNLFWIIHFFG